MFVRSAEGPGISSSRESMEEGKRLAEKALKNLIEGKPPKRRYTEMISDVKDPCLYPLPDGSRCCECMTCQVRPEDRPEGWWREI